MAHYHNEGDSIEGAAASAEIRSVSQPKIKKIEGIGTFYRRIGKIRVIVLITHELNPLKALVSQQSGIKKDDILEAQNAEIWTEEDIEFKLTSNFSNVHGIQSASINCFTYAKVTMPFRLFLERANKLPA